MRALRSSGWNPLYVTLAIKNFASIVSQTRGLCAYGVSSGRGRKYASTMANAHGRTKKEILVGANNPSWRAQNTAAAVGCAWRARALFAMFIVKCMVLHASAVRTITSVVRGHVSDGFVFVTALLSMLDVFAESAT